MFMNPLRQHAQLSSMRRLLHMFNWPAIYETFAQKLGAIRRDPTRVWHLQSLQIFDLDRPSSLFVYLREIGKLFPLLNGL